MRTQNRKQYHLNPIKSPSPDVRHRNTIGDTIAPLEQIQKYQQGRSRQQSPRISNSLIFNHSQVDRLKNQINFLREQLRIMRNNQIEYRSIKQKNTQLHQQLNYYKETHPNHLDKNTFYQNDKILKEFNDRVTKLADQNKKLIKQLQQSTSKIDLIYHQNQILRNQLSSYQQPQHQQLLSYHQPSIQHQPIQPIYAQLQSISNQLQNQFQQHFQLKINQLENKIQVVKNHQNIIQDKLQNSKIYSTRAYKTTPKSIGSNQKNQKYNQSIKIEGQPQPYSPIEKVVRDSQQLYKPQNDKIIQMKAQIDYLRQSCKDKQRQNRTLQDKLRLFNISNQKKNLPYRSQAIATNSQLSGNQSQLVFLKQRMSYLEQDLKNKINKINNFQQQNILKERQSVILKKRLDQSNNIIQVQMANYRAILDEQKRKSQKLFNQKNQLIVKINELQSIKGNDIQLKLQMSKFQKLAQDTRILQQEMNKRTNMLSNTLRQYVLLIQRIKSTLTSPKLQKVISNTNQIQQKQISIETLKVQSNNLIAELRKKLILKEEIILQLQKQKNMLIAQVEQLNTQQFKLKNVIKEYSAPQAKYQKISNTKQIRKKNIGLSLKQCIQQAMTGINKLQLEVNAKLTQINDVRQH